MAESAGAKTQLTGVVGAVVIALMLLFAPTLLRNLPQATLGGIVIVAATSLIEVRRVRRLFRIRPAEFWVSIACFLGVALLGVIPGIFLAIGLGLGQFVHRAWLPYDAVLGRVAGMKGYHDITRHPEGLQIPGLVLYRWDAPLFFANAARFRERVFRNVAPCRATARWVVVAAEPITDIDATAARELSDLLDDLDARGVRFAFAELKGPVWDQLKVYGIADRIGEGTASRRSAPRSTGTCRRRVSDGSTGKNVPPPPRPNGRCGKNRRRSYAEPPPRYPKTGNEASPNLGRGESHATVGIDRYHGHGADPAGTTASALAVRERGDDRGGCGGASRVLLEHRHRAACAHGDRCGVRGGRRCLARRSRAVT